MSTYLDEIRTTLEQTEPGRRALAVCDAAVTWDRCAGATAEQRASANMGLRMATYGLTTETSDPVQPTDSPPTPVYVEVAAEVRYWEDARVNDTEDADGNLIPFRRGDLWCPVIRLADGQVMDWPANTAADVHYKVCDAGEYWLLDANRHRIARWAYHYVPDAFLCQGDTGYGDYIILEIGSDGKVRDWAAPTVLPEEWPATDGEGDTK